MKKPSYTIAHPSINHSANKLSSSQLFILKADLTDGFRKNKGVHLWRQESKKKCILMTRYDIVQNQSPRMIFKNSQRIGLETTGIISTLMIPVPVFFINHDLKEFLFQIRAKYLSTPNKYIVRKL